MQAIHDPNHAFFRSQQVFCNPHIDDAVRFQACVRFKNNIEKYWRESSAR